MPAPRRPTSVAPRINRKAFSRYTSGGFTGARTDLNEFKGWNVVDAGPHGDLIGDLPALRSRSQDLERNAPLGGAAIDRLLTAVIGEGLTALPTVDRKYLKRIGVTDEQCKDFEDAAATLFWHFTENNRCDLSRKESFAQLGMLDLRHTLSGGDAFTVLRYKPRKGDLLGTKLQLLEGARVSQPDAALEDDRFIAGVELDEDGAELAFHITNRHPGERFNSRLLTWSRWAAFDEIGEPLVLHSFRAKRAEEVRGVPILAPVIATLKQITRFSDSELMAAVLASMFTVFIKTPSGEEGLAPIDVGLEADNPTPATDYRMGSGAILDLAEGQEPVFAEPSRPNAQFDPFFDALCKQIGANIGVPYEVLVGRFTASYSASRAALLQFWSTVKGWRSWHVKAWHKPIYNRVIREAVASGLLIAPGFFEDPLARDAWTGCEWTGPQMPEIDRQKAIGAAVDAIKYELSTRQREASQLNGTAWEENHEQLRKESEAIRRDKTTLADVPERTVAAAAPPAATTAPAPAKDEPGTNTDNDEETADVS